LLTAFAEKGALATGEGRVGLASIEDVEVPRSIRSVIGERVGRLPQQSQVLLRLASLLGHDFDLEMLLAVSGQSEADVLDGLDAALEAGIIGALRKDREHFAFAHVLIQQTLYEELPVHRRRRMHLRVGQALEHVPVARSTLSADMARHFLLGGDAESAIRYAIAAGDQAAHRYAHPEASRQYQVALELLDDLDDPATGAEVQYKLGSELFDMARLSEALAAYEASLGSFRRLGNPLGQALAHWGIARLHEGVYEMASAEPHVDEALRLWPRERQDSELVRLLSDATRIKAFVGRIAESSELAERSLALAEQLGDAGLTALALSGVSSHGRGAHGAPDLRLYLERGIDLAMDVGNWRTLTLLYIQRSTNRGLTGDLHGSVADRRLAIDAAERSGQTERMSFAY
jgi:tetratricopeptide (TPR) repeat protein